MIRNLLIWSRIYNSKRDEDTQRDGKVPLSRVDCLRSFLGGLKQFGRPFSVGFQCSEAPRTRPAKHPGLDSLASIPRSLFESLATFSTRIAALRGRS